MLKTKKLYEMQQKLDERIPYEGYDLKNKTLIKLTALRVEIGEMMNEWRIFKVWSKDRKPRRRKDIKCYHCESRGIIWEEGERRICDSCDGNGFHYEHPLLEEYVDGLHFVLSLGLDFDLAPAFALQYVPDVEDWNVMEQVESIHDTITSLRKAIYRGAEWIDEQYRQLLHLYLGLGGELGFSDGEIREAYMSKNKINHVRQDTGY